MVAHMSCSSIQIESRIGGYKFGNIMLLSQNKSTLIPLWVVYIWKSNRKEVKEMFSHWVLRTSLRISFWSRALHVYWNRLLPYWTYKRVLLTNPKVSNTCKCLIRCHQNRNLCLSLLLAFDYDLWYYFSNVLLIS